MKFYKPQLQLAYEFIEDGSDFPPKEFYLHSVTFCRWSNLVGDDYEIVKKDANSIEIHLMLREDLDLPRLKYITPVTHTINLGTLDFMDEPGVGTIIVKVVGKVFKREAGKEPTRDDPTENASGGSAEVRTTNADKKSRPDGDLV